MKLRAMSQVDLYKPGHVSQYPKKTETIFSGFTPRSSKLYNPTKFWNGKVTVFGLQGMCAWFLQNVFTETFFNLPKEEATGYYKRRMKNSLGEFAVPNDAVEDLHDLGYLPIEIKALPEGSLCPIKVPVFTVENTLKDARYSWITNYIETALSTNSWKSYTIATIATELKAIMTHYYELTGTDKVTLPIICHDFSARGLSLSYDSSANNGGHLLSFIGTDTVGAIDYLEDYYNADSDKEAVGVSVPATEHSVACLSIYNIMGYLEETGSYNGKSIEQYKEILDVQDQDVDLRLIAEYIFQLYLITEVYPNGIVSSVADSFDFWGLLTIIAPALKEEILNRGENAMGLSKVVFRPDSGNPVDILCGYKIRKLESTELEEIKCEAKEYIIDRVEYETTHGEMGEMNPSEIFKAGDKYYKVTLDIDWNRYDKQYYYMDGEKVIECVEVEATPEMKGAVETLWDIFGGTLTDKGYKQLNSKVGLIYGDSMNRQRIIEIMDRLVEKGFAADTTVFGIGSYEYQFKTRDTLGFAMKATFGQVDGKERLIVKDPKTDPGKKSACGKMAVIKNNDGEFALMDNLSTEEYDNLEELRLNELKTVFKDGKLINETSLSEIRGRLNEYTN